MPIALLLKAGPWVGLALACVLVWNLWGQLGAANAKLSAANADIARLRGENEALLKQRRAAEAPPVATVLLPKRVLSMAGYWNLSPNDLLRITPILVDTVQQRGGSVVRRDGMNVCFAFHERALLIEAAIHTMTETLPQYERRLDF